MPDYCLKSVVPGDDIALTLLAHRILYVLVSLQNN